MESFFAALKTECVHEVRFRTRAEAQAAVFEYIEDFTIGSACIRPWDTEPRPRLAPAWRRSPCARQPDILISPLHTKDAAGEFVGMLGTVWRSGRRGGTALC